MTVKKLDELNAREERLKAEKAVALAKDAAEKAMYAMNETRAAYLKQPNAFREKLRQDAAVWAVDDADYKIAKDNWEAVRPRRQKKAIA